MVRRRDEELLEKIRNLPPDRIDEVEDFVDFLSQRNEEPAVGNAIGKLSEDALRKVWDNADDAEYDRL